MPHPRVLRFAFSSDRAVKSEEWRALRVDDKGVESVDFGACPFLEFRL